MRDFPAPVPAVYQLQNEILSDGSLTQIYRWTLHSRYDEIWKTKKSYKTVMTVGTLSI